MSANQTQSSQQAYQEQYNDSEIVRQTLRIYGSIYLGCFLLYVVLRRKYPRLFSVRSWVPHLYTGLAKKEYGWFSWLWEVFDVSDEELLQHCGMDALCFIRAMRFGRKLGILGCINAVWLLPLYATAQPSSETSYLTDPLVIVSISNLPTSSVRFAGTVIAAYITFLYAMRLLLREMEWYTRWRHRYLSAVTPCNYAVYVSGIPSAYRTSHDLKTYFDKCSKYAVLEAHIISDTPDLDAKQKRRDEVIRNLEHTVAVQQRLGVRVQHTRFRGRRGLEKVDSVSQYEDELRDLNEEIHKAIREITIKSDGRLLGGQLQRTNASMNITNSSNDMENGVSAEDDEEMDRLAVQESQPLIMTSFPQNLGDLIVPRERAVSHDIRRRILSLDTQHESRYAHDMRNRFMSCDMQLPVEGVGRSRTSFIDEDDFQGRTPQSTTPTSERDNSELDVFVTPVPAPSVQAEPVDEADFGTEFMAPVRDVERANRPGLQKAPASGGSHRSTTSSRSSVRSWLGGEGSFVKGSKVAGKTLVAGSRVARDSLARGSRAATEAMKRAGEELNVDRLIQAAAESGVSGMKTAQQVGHHLVNSAGAVIPMVLTKTEGTARSAGFVVFTDLYSVQTALQMVHHPKPYVMDVHEAPEPKEIFWRNVGLPHGSRRAGRLFSFAASAVLCFFWSIPMAFIASLTDVSSLKTELPKLGRYIDDHPKMNTFLALLAPVLLLFINEVFLPVILKHFATWEGHISTAILEASLFVKLGAFQIIQTFFVSAITGGITSELTNILANPEKIIDLLANSLPAQSSFFIQIILAQTLLLQAAEFLRVYQVGMAVLRRSIGPNLTAKERRTKWGILHPLEDPQEFWHAETFAQIVLYFTIFFVYAVIAPITSLFVLFCFFLLESNYRYQFIHNFPRANDTGGRMYFHFIQFVLACMMIGLMTILGLLLLKKSVFAGPAFIPLPIITILFIIFITGKHSAVGQHLPTRDCVVTDRVRREDGLDFDFVRGTFLQPSLQRVHVEPEYEETMMNDDGIFADGTPDFLDCLDSNDETVTARNKENDNV